MSGPVGIGKTALLDAVREDLSTNAGFTVLSATCGAPDEPLGAVRALFAPPGHRVAGSATRQVRHDLYRSAVDLTAGGPLAIVLDDVHRCDEDSAEWLDFLLRRSGHLPLLVVLGERTGAAGPSLGGLLQHAHCSQLALRPLGAADLVELIAHVLGDPPSEGFARSCAEVSGGNPLVLLRMLEELRAAGTAPDDGAVARAGRNALAAMVPLRLADQHGHVRSVAGALAVLADALDAGRTRPEDGPANPAPEVGPELIGQLATVPPRMVESALITLRDIGSLVPDGLGFTHDAVRSAVLDGIPAAEVVRLRSRAARLLGDAGHRAEAVATLLLLLPELPEPWMVGVLGDAAAAAELRDAPEAAVRYLDRVLEATDDERSHPRIRVGLAVQLSRLDQEAALGHLRTALAATTDPTDRATIAVKFGFTALGMGRTGEGMEVLVGTLDELSAAFGDAPSAKERELRHLVESALLRVGASRKSTIGFVRDRARALSELTGRTPGERRVLSVVSGLLASACAPVAEVVDMARRAVRVRVGADDLTMLSAAVVLRLADEVDEAVAAVDWVLETSREQAPAWVRPWALAQRSLLHHDRGDLRVAATDARAALVISEQNGPNDRGFLPHAALALALNAQGHRDRARVVLDRVSYPDADRSVWEWHEFLFAQARVRRVVGDNEGALRYLERCGRSLAEAGITNPVYAPWWVDAAAALAELGRPEQAGHMVERWSERSARWGTPRALGYAAMARGVTGSGTRAIDDLVEAVEHLTRSPDRLNLAYTELLLGFELLQRDDLKGARDHLRASFDLATRCGAAALSGPAGRLHAAAGGRSLRAVRSTVDMLTGGERRVADMAAGGMGNKEIAEALFVTTRTVEIHLTNTYRKLGIEGRPLLAAALRDPKADEGLPA